MSRDDWRAAGVYRLTVELPMTTWESVRREADRLGLRPAQVIRVWLAEHADALAQRPARGAERDPNMR